MWILEARGIPVITIFRTNMSIGVRITQFLHRLGFGGHTFPDGTRIQVISYDGLLYSETDGHRVELTWYSQSPLVRERKVVLKEHWDGPDASERISPNKRDEILEKVRLFGSRRGIRIAVP
jgi:hypothetical protein